jgi:hypothetical protein
MMGLWWFHNYQQSNKYLIVRRSQSTLYEHRPTLYDNIPQINLFKFLLSNGGEKFSGNIKYEPHFEDQNDFIHVAVQNI